MPGFVDLKGTLHDKCGKILGFNDPEFGPVKNGRLAFREVNGTAQPDVYTLTGKFVDGGRNFEGTFQHTWRNQYTGKHCSTKAPFTAKLVRVDVIAPWDAGRYAGSISPGGQAISFQVTYDPKTRLGSIVGLSWIIGPMECDSFGVVRQHATITSRPSVSGPVAPTGAFTFVFPPPQKDMSAAEGALLRGKASGVLPAGGMYDADGTSDSNGEWLCSYDGTPWEQGDATFVAREQG